MRSKSLIVYLLVPVIFTVIYLGLFRTLLFSSQSVLFYRGNMLMAVAAILSFLVSLLVNKFLKARFETLVAALIMSASLHLAFFVTFPVTFDRSVTMYLLNRLNTYRTPSCQGMTKAQMQEIFIKEYVKEADAMGRRIKEQSIINMMTKNGKCYQLTDRSRDFIHFSEIVMRIYNIKNK